MKTILKFSVVSLSLLVPVLVHAEGDWQNKDITMDVLMENGLLTQRGSIYINGRGTVGQIREDGSVYINGKGTIGSIRSDGTVYKNGTGTIGGIRKDGEIYKSGEGTIGKLR